MVSSHNKPKKTNRKHCVIIPRLPKTALDEKFATIWLIIPKAGKIKM
jgi:hypothetical protein